MSSIDNNHIDPSQAIPIGKDKTFEFFFRQYYASLCYFAYTIIKDEDEAKDIVQDCFIRFWEKHFQIEKSDTIKTFLCTAVRNKCIDLLRKRKLIRKAEAVILKNTQEEFEYFDELAFAETVRQVIDSVAILPDHYKQVVNLYFIEGKKLGEIAATTNSTPEAVRKQKDRALHSIRQKLLSLFTLFF